MLFTLGGTSATVSSVAVDAAAKTVTLTLSEAVKSTDSVTLSYATTQRRVRRCAIQDAAGNDAASLSNRFVTNQTPDDVAPLFSSASVNGATLTLTYTDASLLDATNKPAATAFTLDGTTATVSVGGRCRRQDRDPDPVCSGQEHRDGDCQLQRPDDGQRHRRHSGCAATMSQPAESSGIASPRLQNRSSALDLVAAYYSQFTAAMALTWNGRNFVYRLRQSSFQHTRKNWRHYQIIWFNLSHRWNGSWNPTAGDQYLWEYPETVGNNLIFSDYNSSDYNGVITDGTVAGTKVVADLPLGTVDETRQTMWATLSTAPYGTELFRIDLTTASPAYSMVKDINPGSSGGMGSIGACPMESADFQCQRWNQRKRSLGQRWHRSRHLYAEKLLRWKWRCF